MVSRNVAELLPNHVALEVECIDRLYLNGYVPGVQYIGGFVRFVRNQLGMPIVSTSAVAKMREAFIREIDHFAAEQDVDVVVFRKGTCKEDVAKERLAKFEGHDGVLFIGKAQEKAKVFRTAKRRNKKTGKTYPWIYKGTAMPNHYYFYLVDADFGLMFIKICSYFPYAIKVYLNGHEWVKRQLEKEGIGYTALDNGFLDCEDPRRLQELCHELDEEKIDAVFRKWLARLPHPWSAEHRAAGYRYDLSMIQMEFALTQVFDRPLAGRQFFEAIIRDHLDMGRPQQVQLIFGRRVTRRTPGSFRTRVITDGVLPSINVYYKWSRIKQYFKLGRALRTETVVNNTRDFDIGRRLCNLPQLRQIGFKANRRLLSVQTLSHDCMIGQKVFASVNNPVECLGQRGSALRFGDPRVMALMSALCSFFNLPSGFRNAELRANVAQLLGKDPDTYKPGRMTYDLRRLRLHGLIERIPGKHRYNLIDLGIRVAVFFSKAHARILVPALSIQPSTGEKSTRSTTASKGIRALQNGIDLIFQEACMLPQT